MTGLLTLILNACGTVTIKDSTWCGSLGPQGAACFHTLTDQETDLTADQWNTTWNDLSHPMVATSSDTLTAWKDDIEQLCTSSQSCSYEQVQTQQRVLRFIENIKSLGMDPQ